MASILLVEDVLAVRAVLREFLESAGHGVTECDGGEKASRLAARGRFDAVVTDICMKDGDGLEFIRRQRSHGAAIPIVAMTGGDPRLPQSRSAQLALRAGASRVLIKPVTKADLLNALGEAVAGQRNGSSVIASSAPAAGRP